MAKLRDPVVLRAEDYRRDMERMVEAQREVKRLQKEVQQLQRDNDNLRRRLRDREEKVETITRAVRDLSDALGLDLFTPIED